jgi:DNA-binding transcriptional regulator LsrR (DeoR family)
MGPDRFMLLAVAYLLGSKRRSQREVAEIIGISASYVNKLKSRALKDGYLVEDVRFVGHGLSESDLAEVEARATPKALARELQQLAEESRVAAPCVRVFPGTVRTAKSREGWGERLDAFGISVATYLAGILANSNVCGVAWGETLSAIVRGLERIGPPAAWAKRPLMFVPIAGEPLGKGPAATSASTLAQRLDEIVSGDTQHRSSLSLGALPALIPREFSVAEEQVIKKLFRFVDAYRAVFGGDGYQTPQPPWIERIDMLLTSVGPLERPLGYGGNALLRAADVDVEELRRMIAGDVAGVLLPRPALNPKARDTLADIRRRWRGIQDVHLRRCAERGRKGRPGIVIVALGANKAATVREVVQRGLVNHLLIDDDLAEALQRLLHRRERRRAGARRS